MKFLLSGEYNRFHNFFKERLQLLYLAKLFIIIIEIRTSPVSTWL